MKNLINSIADDKAPVKIVLKAEVLNPNGDILVEQNLVFETPTTMAMNHAIENMGKSFIHGVGVSVSQLITDSQKEFKEPKKCCEPK